MTPSDNSPLAAHEVAAEILAAQEAREPAASIAVVDGADELLGRRMVVRAVDDGPPRRIGSLGDAELDRAVVELATNTLNARAQGSSGTHELSSEACGDVRLYVEVHRPHPDLLIIGAGHIARPLCTVAALIGFRVTVVDDRPDFATTERFPEATDLVRVDFLDPFAEISIHNDSHIVLVTRGHKYDFECLRRLLKMEVEPPYIGMIGSRRRIRAAFAQLVQEGLPRERIEKIRAPLGLDIGAETPAEIAVSVASELVLLARGGEGLPLTDKERVLDRFF